MRTLYAWWLHPPKASRGQKGRLSCYFTTIVPEVRLCRTSAGGCLALEQLLWATVHRPKSESRRQLHEACVFNPRQSLPCRSLGFLTSQVCRQSGLLCPSGGGRKAPGKGKPPCTKLRCWGCCRAVGWTVLGPGHSPPPVSDTHYGARLSPQHFVNTCSFTPCN